MEFPFFNYTFASANGSLIININTIMAKLIEIFSRAGQGKSLIIFNKILQSVKQEKKCLLIIDESEVGLYRKRISNLCDEDSKKLHDNCDVIVLCAELYNDDILYRIKEIVAKYKDKKFDNIFVDCLYIRIRRKGKDALIMEIEDYNDIGNIIITEQLTFDAVTPYVLGDYQFVCEKEKDNIVLRKIRTKVNVDLFTEEKEIFPII